MKPARRKRKAGVIDARDDVPVRRAVDERAVSKGRVRAFVDLRLWRAGVSRRPRDLDMVEVGGGG